MVTATRGDDTGVRVHGDQRHALSGPQLVHEGSGLGDRIGEARRGHICGLHRSRRVDDDDGVGSELGRVGKGGSSQGEDQGNRREQLEEEQP